MRIDRNVPITMDDGLILSADVFRPVFDGKYQVILAVVPYEEGLALQDGYPNESLLRTERILHTSGQHIT